MVTDKVAEPGVFHVWSRKYNRDDRILDPERPESLVYWKPPDPAAPRQLLGFMFRIHDGPLPLFAGTIPSWHTHNPGGDQMTEDLVGQWQIQVHAVRTHPAVAVGELPEEHPQTVVEPGLLGDRHHRSQPA